MFLRSSQKYQSCKLTNSALLVKYTTRSNRYRVPDFIIIIYPYPGSLFHRNSVLCVAIISRERNRIRLIFQPFLTRFLATRSLLIVDDQSQIYFSICSTARPRPVYVLELFSPRNRSDWVVIRWYSLTIIFNGYNWTIRNPRLARPLTRHREKKIIFVRLRSHSFLRFPPSFQTYLRFRVPFKSLLFIYL